MEKNVKQDPSKRIIATVNERKAKKLTTGKIKELAIGPHEYDKTGKRRVLFAGKRQAIRAPTWNIRGRGTKEPSER